MYAVLETTSDSSCTDYSTNSYESVTGSSYSSTTVEETFALLYTAASGDTLKVGMVCTEDAGAVAGPLVIATGGAEGTTNY